MQTTRLVAVVLVAFFVSAAADSLSAQTIIHVPLYTFHGDSAGDYLGFSVSGAGDVNGDGFADLIAGAPYSDNNGNMSGSARVFSGSDGSVLYTFNGNNTDDNLGNSVSGAGDVNGDGFADTIIASKNKARVFSGSDGSVLYTFNDDIAGSGFGNAVSGAGDVNGDGIDDLVVADLFAPNDGSVRGSATVFSGSDGSVLYTFYGDRADFLGYSLSLAGDVNGDGFADLIVGSINNYASVFSGSDGSVLYTFNGDVGGRLGHSVGGAGDVNGDGFADLIVGDIVASNDSGSASVFSGSDGSVLYTFNGDNTDHQFGWSVSGAGDVNGDGFADTIIAGKDKARVFSGSDGSVLYTFNGDNSYDNFGYSVSGAGDLNGDGFDDFIVGAVSGVATSSGYARVFVSQIAELGDCNHDGVVNFLDIGPFISILSTQDFLFEADIDQNGVVDFLDIQHFIAVLAS